MDPAGFLGFRRDCPGVDFRSDCPGVDLRRDCPGVDLSRDCPGVDLSRDCPGVNLRDFPGVDFSRDCPGLLFACAAGTALVLSSTPAWSDLQPWESNCAGLDLERQRKQNVTI